MATMTVNEFLYRASTLLRDMDPQFTRWLQRELVNWINDGQRAIAKYLPLSCVRVDAVKLVPGTRQSIALIPAARVIPGDGSAAVDVQGVVLQDIVRNLGSNGTTVGAAITPVERDTLDSLDPDWHTKTDNAAISHFVFDPRAPKHFYVSPGVPAGGLWVEAVYSAIPATLVPTTDYTAGGAASTTLGIDDQFVDDLLNYVLSRAFQKDGEGAASLALAAAYGNSFVNALNIQAEKQTGINPNLSMLPFSPAVPATAR